MPALKIDNLKKTYQSKAGPIKALKGVSFEIEKGEFFGLLGPNGAGKSTIINILGGIVNKSSGSATIAGINIDDNHTEAKRKIGIVPQEISIDPFVSIEKSLSFQFGYYGKKVDQEWLDYLLKQLSLEDKRNAIGRALSGGMKRRYMIARALIHDPEVIILDEPTAGVDIELRQDLYKFARELHAKGKTIILTSHYLEEVELLCDRIAIINKGQLSAIDHKDSLKQKFHPVLTLRIELETPLEHIPDSLKSYSPKQEGNKLDLSFEQHEYDDIMKAIGKTDMIFKKFTVIEPSLEDVFMTLTK